MPTTNEAGFEVVSGKMPSPGDNNSTSITRTSSPDPSSRGSGMVSLVSMDRARFVVEASSMLECKLLRAMVDGEPRRLPLAAVDFFFVFLEMAEDRPFFVRAR